MASYFEYRGWTGKGIDVAVIDSGVSPVYDLNGSGQVLYDPDLSNEAGTKSESLDTHGHGSHIAGSQARDRLGGASNPGLSASRSPTGATQATTTGNQTLVILASQSSQAVYVVNRYNVTEEHRPGFVTICVVEIMKARPTPWRMP